MDTAPGHPDGEAAWLDAASTRGLQVGSHNVQHNEFVGHTLPLVRSPYLQQVRRIAPPELKDRDGELADLAAFCTGEPEHAYAWWRAPAWSGKTALMSWFVLHPPPGVRIVSFFVTAQSHRQNDRKAFIDNVLLQLSELLRHRSLPAGLTESTQDTHLAAMLAAAAAACRRSDERLVLVVDGLDEDRGVTVGSESYSIAAILPRQPPAGLRVVVSSRTDPPLPPDVAPDHPLRGRCLARELSQSACAEVVRADAERELKRIILAGGVERDLLGFVTVAGGLSIRDLAELAETDEWLVEDHLSSFTGRTFTCADTAYVLAHEELQPTATRLLGAQRLPEYRSRLHRWADRYRDLGWPSGTPGYLLRGYVRMVAEQGELALLVRCATDPDRHDRMLDHTGGDAVALEEITLAQDALLAATGSDLPAMCELALRRAGLEERNTNVPLTLPSLWAAVGNVARAEALVHSIPEDANRRAAAMALLAPELARSGHPERAELLVGLLPTHIFMDADLPALATCRVVGSLTRAGDRDRATTLARGIDAPFWQSRAYCEIAVALAGTSLAEAERSAHLIAMPYWRAQALSALAREANLRGRHDLATHLAEAAVRAAEATSDDRALAYAYLAQQAQLGGPGDARHLADLATTEATTDQPYYCVRRLAKILPLLAEVLDEARRRELAALAESMLAEALVNRPARSLLNGVASSWCAAGDYDRAVAVSAHAADRSDRESVLLGVAASAAAAGALDRALQVADSLAGAGGRDRALGRIVAGLTDEHGDARTGELVGGIRDPAMRAAALADWGLRIARRGDRDAAGELARRAEAIARSTGDPSSRAQLLTSLVSALVAAGDINRAGRAARRAVAAPRATPEQSRPHSMETTLVRAAASAGDGDAAAEAADLINDPRARVAAQTGLAPQVARRNARDLAVRLLDAAEATAVSILGRRRGAEALREVMTALWVVGEDRRAEDLASRLAGLADPEQPLVPVPAFPAPGEDSPTLSAAKRDEALVKAVEAIAAAGDFARAEALGDLITGQRRRAAARSSVVLALAGAGLHDRARALARSIPDPHHRGQSLRQLAGALADQGAVDAAEEVARSIDDGFDRVAALIALARKADPARARSLLLVPVQQGRMPEILDLLAAVCPTALDLVADRLLAEPES
jgi:hypothetical protein